MVYSLYTPLLLWAFAFSGISAQWYFLSNTAVRHFNGSNYPSLTIPLDLSTYSGFTIEAWVTWTSGDVYPHNQTLFSYGNENDYIWVTPCDGVSGFNGYATETGKSAPLGIVRSADHSYRVSNGLRSNRFSHFAFTHDNQNLVGSFYTHTEAVPATIDNIPVELEDVVFFDSTVPSGVLRFGDVPGDDPTSTRDLLEVKGPYNGYLAEVRIWDHKRTKTQIENLRHVSLTGFEEGLVRYYRLDESTGNTLVDATANQDVQVPVGGPSALFNIPSGTFLEYEFPFVYNMRRKSRNAGEDIFLSTVNTESGDGYQPSITNFPEGGPITINGRNSPSFNIFRFMNVSVPATEETCGQVYEYTLQGLGGFGQSLIQTFSFAFDDLDPGFTGHRLLPSTLSVVQFTGAFGPNRVLPSGSVEYRIFGTDYECRDATVTGTTLTCTLEALGVDGDLTFSYCGETFNYPSALSFPPPVINNTVGLNGTAISISGSNFGPSRFYTNTVPAMDEVSLDDISCDSMLISHNSIVCSFPFVQGADYRLKVTVGGQTIFRNFTFVLCSPPCANGFECVGEGVCDCPPTLLPPSCAAAVECTPSCVEGGVCNYLVNEGGGIDSFCVCPEGVTSIDCGSGAPTVLIVSAVVVGALLLIAATVAVAFVFVYKNRRRSGKNFIPLEKKDFSKIIYGDQLNQTVEKNIGDLKGLETLLINKMEVVFMICGITQVTEADKIAKALVIVFQDNQKVLSLLEHFISQEVKDTESAGTLFRSNSMVSKMFKSYARLIALPYLYVTLGPEISLLVEQELGLELDPEKMEEGKDLDEMRWELMSQSQKILKQIFNSEDTCPGQFKHLFAHIKQEVTSRFPESVYSALGGFLFLRFFCPAVSSPEAYGILEEPPSAGTRRLLILITKVLQNLSNDVEFGAKEPYMTNLNDFIHSNRSKLRTFFDKLSKPSGKEAPCVLPKNIKAVSLGVISKHLQENLSKISDPEVKAEIKALVEA